jgi:hypothetical protein
MEIVFMDKVFCASLVLGIRSLDGPAGAQEEARVCVVKL